MCKPASFIVTRELALFCHTDSHEDIPSPGVVLGAGRGASQGFGGGSYCQVAGGPADGCYSPGPQGDEVRFLTLAPGCGGGPRSLPSSKLTFNNRRQLSNQGGLDE